MAGTIDYGIDLGTTNSAIARQMGGQTEVISENGELLVPSVVHVAADRTICVGKQALNYGEDDPSNIAKEFKRLMGTSEVTTFPASQKSMTPEELSAEILKNLIQRAQPRSGEAIAASVITIPAMFQLPQCEATRNAARLAGLQHAPLLQEPIAAAIACVGSTELRDGYWLIYDLGGGTFDVSLLRSRSGRLQVLDHDGDNHLGGKDFDRILARHAADKVRAEGRLPAFRRSDADMASAFARLKTEAERVRIALSNAETAQFRVDQLAKTPEGTWVPLEFQVSRDELEALIRPTMAQTIQLCRTVLARNNLKAQDLKRIVLVGGPTLTPCLTRIIETDLGIEARHFVDPIQAVTIGAAIYASTQQLPTELRRSRQKPDELAVELSYESMTNDARPVVAGQIVGARDAGDWKVKIASETGGSGAEAVAVRADGAFAARLQLTPNATNVFNLIVTRDSVSVPDLQTQFVIIHGTSIAKPVLSQSVGVMLADNTVRWYLRKGVVLPARQSVSHATTIGLRRGQSGFAVNVPLIQGESEHGDRNMVVGVIQIEAENLARDLPVGSEVIVTLSVDEHSTTGAEAFVPLLEQTFRQVVKFGMETRSTTAIREGVESQRSRLAELQKLADQLDDSPETNIDNRVHMIEELLEDGGADERSQADQLLHKVTGLIDSLEVRDKKSNLMRMFAESDHQIRQLLQPAEAEMSRQLAALTVEFHNAIARADLQLAETKFKAVKNLEWALIRQQPGFWRALFDYLTEAALKGPNAAEARIAIDNGKAAINRNDLPGLVQACMELFRLLPQKDRSKLPAILSNVA